MKVADCMTRNVKMASPQESLRDASRMMAELDAGILPVADGDRLVGMITDRDICVRGIALGKGPDAKVADVMSRDVRLVSPEDTVQQAARLMRDEDTGILPVGDGDRLVGMITDRDIAVRLAAEGNAAW